MITPATTDPRPALFPSLRDFLARPNMPLDSVAGSGQLESRQGRTVVAASQNDGCTEEGVWRQVLSADLPPSSFPFRIWEQGPADHGGWN